jgi:hypothetical protein
VPKSARARLAEQIDAIEGAYEFFLAYAAQGLREEAAGSRVAGQLREHLTAMRGGVSQLAGLLDGVIAEDGSPSRDRLRAFREVVAVDAGRAVAALDLVDAQPFATSQLVDNLNASVHVRTVLTDLFLLDELLGLGVAAVAPEASRSSG